MLFDVILLLRVLGFVVGDAPNDGGLGGRAGRASPFGPSGGALIMNHTPFLQFDYCRGLTESAQLSENSLQLMNCPEFLLPFLTMC